MGGRIAAKSQLLAVAAALPPLLLFGWCVCWHLLVKMIGCREFSAVYSLVLILFQLINFACAETPPFNDLPLCRNYQACGSRLKSFPLVDDSIGELIEEIGSGQGSGNEPEVHMLYDEFAIAKTPFDFNADPELIQKRLCRCADETEDDQKCSFDEMEKLMQIDSTLSLSFCQPIQNLFRLKCLGRRHMVRVMGPIHENGEALTDVNDTAAFCTCPGSYQRAKVEPWVNGVLYIFSYRCSK